MGIITAVKAGNWSDPTVWDSGVLPQAGDTVRPGAYAVIIDQDVDLGAGALEGVAGASGYFRVNVPDIHITCDHITNTNTYIVQYYHTTGQCYLNADIVAGTVASKDCCRIFGAGGLTVVGDITGGDVAINSFGLTLQVAGEPITITGNIRSGLADGGTGFYCIYARTVTINGNITSHGSYACVIQFSVEATINGNVRCIAVGRGGIQGGVMVTANSLYGSPWRLIVNGDVEAYDDPAGPFGQYGLPGIRANPGVCVLVTGNLTSGAWGTPAIAGLYIVDKTTPVRRVQVPHIDTETDEVELWQYHRGNPVIGSRIIRGLGAL